MGWSIYPLFYSVGYHYYITVSTAFFLMEHIAAGGRCKTFMIVGAFMTLLLQCTILLRALWVQCGTSPILHRYNDWIIIVPLQMTKTY